jgi:transcriptional regulator with XRE-family HTH domain
MKIVENSFAMPFWWLIIVLDYWTDMRTYGATLMIRSNENDKSFRTLLIQSRRARMWSVLDAAAASQFSAQQWRNFEAGRALPTLERLENICEALGLDLLPTFRKWADAKLEGLEASSQLKTILADLQSNESNGSIRSDAEGAVRDLIEGAKQIPLDAPTARLIYGLIDLIAKYRKSLTCPIGSPKDLRVAPFLNGPDGVSWTVFEGKSLTKQHPVGWNQQGLGYLATIVRIEPDSGAFHQHLEGRYLDAGTEFFSVIHGAGFGFFERERKKAEWKVSPLVVGSCGLYRGNRGHAYVNTADVPLLVYIVCVPFPPTLSQAPSAHGKRTTGYAEGIEFRLSEVLRTALPTSLKTKIRETYHEQVSSIGI